jgi:hypothetical protein
MSKISFSMNFKSSELNDAILPVEVRKPNLAVEKRGLSIEHLDIKPGNYIVSARLPGGQEISQFVEVGSLDQVIQLKPLPAEESPFETHEAALFLGSQVPSQSVDPFIQELAAELNIQRSVDVTSIPTSPSISIRTFELGPGGFQPVPPLTRLFQVPSVPSVLQFNVAGSRRRLVLQVSQVGLPAMNVVLPVAENMNGMPIGCIVMLSALADGRVDLDIHLNHRVANLLVKYLERGYLAEAISLTSGDMPDDARNLLHDKTEEPIAAATGAYALLKSNRLDRLPLDWTRHLRDFFPWLAEGSVIHGEQLARLAQHQEALDSFLQLEDRGLPMFTAGLSYALDRLRQYSDSSRSTVSRVDPGSIQRASDLCSRLSPFGEFADLSHPFVSFTGLDPNVPELSFVRDLALIDGIAFVLPPTARGIQISH